MEKSNMIVLQKSIVTHHYYVTVNWKFSFCTHCVIKVTFTPFPLYFLCWVIFP